MAFVTKTLIACVAAAGALASMNASAHGIWFAQRANQVALIYGVGADDLDMVKRMSKVKAVSGYDEEGKEVATSLVVQGPLPLVDLANQPAMVTAILDNGLWSKTPDGKWHNKGKDEVPGAIVSEWTIKYTVHLRMPLNVVVPQVPGHALQIIPLDKKLPEKYGTPTKFRVLYQGKPARGALVKADYVTDPDAKGVKTGADGIATLKIRNQGLNVVVATYDAPPPDPARVNKVEHLATLSFVLPHEPE